MRHSEIKLHYGKNNIYIVLQIPMLPAKDKGDIITEKLLSPKSNMSSCHSHWSSV